MFSHRHLTRLIMGDKVSAFVWFHIIVIEFRPFVLNNKVWQINSTTWWKTTARSQTILHLDALYNIKRKKYKTVCAELAFAKVTFTEWSCFFFIELVMCFYLLCSWIIPICNLFHFWNNFQALKYNLWAYKQWEFLLLIKQSLNIGIIQLHSK
jgi:hypothetical protein